jgi:hypothetical protein
MRRFLWHCYGAIAFLTLFLSGIYLSECLTAQYEVSVLEKVVGLLFAIAGFLGAVHYATRLRQNRR